MSKAITIDDVLEDFASIDEWEERYTYLIELGRTLPAFPENGRIEVNRIQGCQSRVWLLPSEQGSGFRFLADSDSQIVQGLIAVLMSLYLGKDEDSVLAIDEKAVFRALGLDAHLSAGRRNGLSSLVLGIQRMAQHAVCERARKEEVALAETILSPQRAIVG